MYWLGSTSCWTATNQHRLWQNWENNSHTLTNVSNPLRRLGSCIYVRNSLFGRIILGSNVALCGVGCFIRHIQTVYAVLILGMEWNLVLWWALMMKYCVWLVDYSMLYIFYRWEKPSLYAPHQTSSSGSWKIQQLKYHKLLFRSFFPQSTRFVDSLIRHPADLLLDFRKLHYSLNLSITKWAKLVYL